MISNVFHFLSFHTYYFLYSYTHMLLWCHVTLSRMCSLQRCHLWCCWIRYLSVHGIVCMIRLRQRLHNNYPPQTHVWKHRSMVKCRHSVILKQTTLFIHDIKLSWRIVQRMIGPVQYSGRISLLSKVWTFLCQIIENASLRPVPFSAVI